MARKKKLVSDVYIHGIADRGKAVGRDAEGQVYFVDKAVPGDTVDVLVLRKKKSFSQGIVKAYKSYSDDRVNPVCQHFGICGGCKWQNLEYGSQLIHKYLTVKNAMVRIARLAEEIVHPIVPCSEIYQYRNKLEYSFSSKKWLTEAEIQSEEDFSDTPSLGFHAPGSFDKVVDVEKCWLQDDFTNTLRNFIREFTLARGWSFYNARAQRGFMRNMFFRNNRKSQWMITIVFGQDDQEKIWALCNAIKAQFMQVTSLFYMVNTKRNDSVFDLQPHLFSGEDHLKEVLGRVEYKIGPKSFFQTNTEQAEVLFKKVAEFAQCNGSENVYDLYTGIGSIALFLADQAKQVVAIEEIPEAIKDAKENARLNDIHNVVFYAGDVKEILTDSFKQKHGHPDLVITDPPRAGMHPQVVEYLLALAAPKIVYVSCNPATQARDLDLLQEKYRVIKVQPVDMFPHTHHIESIALLHLK